MKNIINTIIAMSCIVSTVQIYGMDQKTAMQTTLKHLNNSTDTSEMSSKHLEQALNYGIDHNKFCKTDLSHSNTVAPTHSVSIVKEIATVGNDKVTIIKDINALQNKVGQEGLKTIHDQLMTQYATQQDDVFADFEEPLLAILFHTTNKATQQQELSAIICERKFIPATKLQPSIAKKLHHALTNEDTYKKLFNNYTTDSNNKKSPYFIAAGISLSVLVLLFIAHKLNLLPTDFFKTASYQTMA